ncbi:hypothetical protein D3C72_466350 [compost metagenome]
MGDTAGELADSLHLLRVAQGIFGALAFEHLVLQTLVGLGQLFGAGADPFFQGFVEIAQGFFGFLALGLIDHKDIETTDRAVGGVTRQVIHQRVAIAAIAVRGIQAE